MSIIEKIWMLKSKILDIRSHICSELCKNPSEEYKLIIRYEKEILELRKKLIEEEDERA